LNERIKLPAQEWLGYDPEKGDIHGHTFEQMREFAELIVQECADVASGLSASTVALRIKQHFGIKE
jgi:hypothetical protein